MLTLTTSIVEEGESCLLRLLTDMSDILWHCQLVANTSPFHDCTGIDLVSPETASAAQTLLDCHDDACANDSTNYARLRSEANKQLTPICCKDGAEHNKKAGVQIFAVGQNVGLQIPVDHREKLDDKYIDAWSSRKNPITATG